MAKRIVGVLRGGKIGNYNKSLRDGGKVISHINENLGEKWKVVDIFIDKDGVWHLGGLPIVPTNLNSKVDIVWSFSDPNYSKVLEDMSMPYVGNGHFPKIFESKELLKEHMKKIDVKIPRFFVIPSFQKDFDGDIVDFVIKKAKEVHGRFSSPWVVKTLTGDPNVAIHVAKTFPELVDAIFDCAKSGESVLVEESILGRNVSVHTVPGFRGEELYHFPFSENKDERIIVPGKFSSEEKKNILEVAKNIFKHTNAKHYLGCSFVIHPRLGIYLTGIEFSPNLNEESVFSRSCESVGAKAYDVIDHILEGFFR